MTAVCKSPINETLAAGFVSEVTDRLSRQYPEVVFHLVPADRAMLLNRELPQRTIELAVTSISDLGLQNHMEVKPLFDDQFVVIAGVQNKWVNRRKLALAELSNEPWVLPPPDSLPGLTIAEMFHAEGLQPPQAHIVTFSIPLHLHLLATGRFLTHAAKVDATVRQALAAQAAAGCNAQEKLFNRDHHVEEPNAGSVGAAFH